MKCVENFQLNCVNNRVTLIMTSSTELLLISKRGRGDACGAMSKLVAATPATPAATPAAAVVVDVLDAWIRVETAEEEETALLASCCERLVWLAWWKSS